MVDINYNKCAEALARTGIGSGYVPSSDVAKATLYASIVEGTDSTLIAVTWAAEAVPPFNFNPVSNPRQDGGADVGPMGTATTIWTAERFTRGLADPFGTTRTKFEKFNGDSYDNLRLGARALNDVAQRTSNRADTAGQYRAGTRTGFGYNDRVGQFNRDYSYFNDGRLKQLTDLDDVGGQPSQVTFHYMSRAYSYDHTGRVSSVSAIPNQWSLPAPFSGNYGYDAFDNMTSRSGRYGLNSDQADSATYTNNRRAQTGWSYDADGRISISADTSDAGGSSTRTWSYDVAGNEINVAQTASGSTTTDSLAYDGDSQLLYESVANQYSTTSDYLIRSTVLGAVLTKLNASGNKDTTYVPANGLVMPLQQNYYSSPSVSWVHRDASGLQEDGKAYDPVGNLIYNVQPPSSGPAPYMPFYGATYGGASWSSFSNANNLAAGCNYRGTPMDCTRAMIATMGLEFVSNLPGLYLDNAYAEQGYREDVRDASVRKPKGPPTLKPAPKRSHAETDRLRNENAGVGDDEGDPQNPASTPCPGSIPEAIGRQILRIASQEKIDPTLLSVTMRHESSFGKDMTPNPRYGGKGRRRRVVGYDVGPMGIGTNIWNKSPFTDGLSGDPFGSIMQDETTQEYVSFNGDFEANIIVAARAFSLDILPRSHGKNPLLKNADAAGMYRGPGDYQGRYDQYVQEAPGDRHQLDCIGGKR